MINKDEVSIVVNFIRDTLYDNSSKSIIINKLQSYSLDYLKEIVYILNLANPYNNEEVKRKNPKALEKMLNRHKTMTYGDAIDFINKNLENKNEFLSLLNEGYNLYVNE